MSRLKSPRRPWLYTWLPLLISGMAAVAAVVGAIIAVHRTWTDPAAGQSKALALLVLVVLVAVLAREALQVFKAYGEVQATSRLAAAGDIQAACQVLRDQLEQWHREEVRKLPEDVQPAAFRACVYRVTGQNRTGVPRELERVTAYCVGRGGNPGEPGKRISSACGVIGLAFRTGSPQQGYRESEDVQTFRDEMVQDWGFDPEDAKTLNETRWSFLAVPLKTSDGRVDAVIFLDSAVRNCFDDDVVNTLVLPAAGAITTTIDRRNRDVIS